jgi:hypothetical protein
MSGVVIRAIARLYGVHLIIFAAKFRRTHHKKSAIIPEISGPRKKAAPKKERHFLYKINTKYLTSNV